MGRKRKPQAGPSQRSIADFYRSIQAVADNPETDSELDYVEEKIPEVEDLRRDPSRGRPPPRCESEPEPEPESGQEDDEDEEGPSVSRPRRGASRRRRRRPTPSPPPPGDSSSSSSSSSSPEPDAWEPTGDDVPSEGEIQIYCFK